MKTNRGKIIDLYHTRYTGSDHVLTRRVTIFVRAETNAFERAFVWCVEKKKKKKKKKKTKQRSPLPHERIAFLSSRERGGGRLLRFVWQNEKSYAICIYTYPRIATHKPGYRDRAFSTQMAMGYTHLGCSLNYCTLFDANRKGVRRVMF